MFKSLYGKYARFSAPLMDITMVWVQFNGASILLSQAGVIATTIFGINKWVLIILIAAVGLLGSLFGAEVFRRIQGCLTIVLLISMLLIFGGALVIKGANVTRLVSENWMPEGATISSALYWGAMYGVANISFIGVLLPNNDILKTGTDTRRTLFLGYIMNTVITLLSCWTLLAYAPSILAEDVPNLLIAKDVYSSVGLVI